jgi:hypothetical protein
MADFLAPAGVVFDEFDESVHVVAAEQLPQRFDEVIVGVDWGTSNRGSMVVLGIDPAMNFYLLDGYCHRMKLSARQQHLFELHDKWSKAPGVRSVDVGYERVGVQADIEHMEMEMMALKDAAAPDVAATPAAATATAPAHDNQSPPTATTQSPSPLSQTSQSQSRTKRFWNFLKCLFCGCGGGGAPQRR